jgi:hypothetical protein
MSPANDTTPTDHAAEESFETVSGVASSPQNILVALSHAPDYATSVNGISGTSEFLFIESTVID